jgi:hypothetical protein
VAKKAKRRKDGNIKAFTGMGEGRLLLPSGAPLPSPGAPMCKKRMLFDFFD